jgi:hypothetical protein
MFSRISMAIKGRSLCFVAFFILTFGVGQAATTAGTLILTQPISVWYNSDFVVSGSVPVTINVAPIYGIAVSPNLDYVVTISSAVSVNLSRTIFNRANTADQVLMGATPSSLLWSVHYYLDNNGDGIRQSTENTELIFPVSMPQESTLSIIIQYTPQASAGSCVIPLQIQTISTPNGGYLGYNGLAYAGAGNVLVTDNIVFIPQTFVIVQVQALLQGYYDPAADSMLAASVILELRSSRNVPAVLQYVTTLNNQGWSEPITCNGTVTGNYYVYLKHFNHLPVVSQSDFSMSSTINRINFSDPTSVNFQTMYYSPSARGAAQTLYPETNGRLTIRGGSYDGDPAINIVDWAGWNAEWDKTGVADYDGNGKIDTRDYGIWLKNNQAYLPLD